MLSTFNLVPTKAASIKAGEMYGQLTVLETGQIANSYRYFAICQCSCGSPPKAIRFDGLKNGKVVSCGCVQRERATTHGLTKSPHYNRWANMIDRCENPECAAFDDYGGRGIEVCERWHDLAAFIEDIQTGYFEGAEIDRIDNDGDYEPGNVRWVSRKGNSLNRRSTRWVEYQGRTQTLSDWEREFGLSRGIIANRIDKWGWSIERAITTPPVDATERMARARQSQRARKAH